MLTNISTTQLRQLLRLSERKEALFAQIQRIDREMAQIGGTDGEAPARQRNASGPRKTGGRRARRGALKEKVLAALRSGGRKGVTVRELADKLGVRSGNLYVWFNSTGRKVPGLKKVGPARYRLS